MKTVTTQNQVNKRSANRAMQWKTSVKAPYLNRPTSQLRSVRRIQKYSSKNINISYSRFKKVSKFVQSKYYTATKRNLRSSVIFQKE